MDRLNVFLETYLVSSLFMSMVVSFIAGLLTSFTPCVYPLIPITVAVISGKTLGEKSKFKVFLASLVYISGVAVVYTFLGVFVAFSGQLFGQLTSGYFFNVLIGIIMVVFGLIMLDIFRISEHAIMQKINKNKHFSGLFGIFLIGVSAGFVFAPCTAPVLAVLLAYLSTTKNVLMGGASMFAFSLGLTMLLLLVGTFSGFLAMIPKSGKWMLYVQNALGIGMILLGLWYLIGYWI